MTSENATKIKFMECRMMGEDSKFVLQMDGNQYLFQVLEFTDIEQYKAFAEANKKTGMPYAYVGSRNVALRFSGNIQHVTITQDTARKTVQDIIKVGQEAAKWYDQFLNKNMDERVKSYLNWIGVKSVNELTDEQVISYYVEGRKNAEDILCAELAFEHFEKLKVISCMRKSMEDHVPFECYYLVNESVGDYKPKEYGWILKP